jgi:hypothetical protein
MRKRFATGRDHGRIATVVEEVLRELRLVESWYTWMKSEITAAFGRSPDCGGTALLHALNDRWRAGHRPRVILVGHSAGSIYIANLIEHAKALMPQARFEVLFLAPAISFRRFSRTIEINGEAIESIHNISLGDVFERADRCPGYPRSLLYFTSGVMEEDEEALWDVPIIGMQRYYRSAFPDDGHGLKRALNFFAARPGSLAWIDGSKSTRGVSTARRHGDFDADPVTQRTLMRYMGKGAAAFSIT